MLLRHKLYNALVNRQPGISYRYHKLHDGSVGIVKIVSWFYLLWLNFAYYVLWCHSLGKLPQMEIYESKRLNSRLSESEAYLKENPKLMVSEYIRKLKDYDVISFDIFDTLIFRPLALPTDIFYLIGEGFDNIDFKNTRAWAEWDARVKCNQKYGHMEVTLEDIWHNLSEDTGLPMEEGMEKEKSIESSLCYANPFMKEVWKELRKLGKRIILVSDMYLPANCIAEILENEGFTGAEKVYVSNEYSKNKASGSLFKLVKREIGDVSVIHVGDNPHSDGVMAKANGFDTCLYLNVNHNALLYRPFDMSYLVGSAYRGIVSNHLYNGLNSYSIEYEYGFIYGGLFVLGYCDFIHRYYKLYGLDKLLFLSRDGDILKQAYDFLYADDNTEYVYWSRKAATKLMANEDRHDFFRRFIYHKVNQKYSIKEILHSMELDSLASQLGEWKNIWLELEKKRYVKGKISKTRQEHFIDLKPDDELTDKNGYLLRKFIEVKWEQVLAIYQNQMDAAGIYYKEVLQGCCKAAAVDIGWAGSGALALSHLTEQVWNIPCKITGVIAGTNTIHNAEPDASEPFLQSGRLVAYLYSQSHNRDLLKKHDPNKDYNIFWELLLSSPRPQFQGFSLYEDGTVKLNFGSCDKNPQGIREIQRGILDFVREYYEHFKDFPYMFHISGRDAYAPMLVAASHNEKYLKEIEKRFSLERNVG